MENKLFILFQKYIFLLEEKKTHFWLVVRIVVVVVVGIVVVVIVVVVGCGGIGYKAGLLLLGITLLRREGERERRKEKINLAKNQATNPRKNSERFLFWYRSLFFFFFFFFFFYETWSLLILP